MKRIFIDTAAFIALGNRQDNWHEQAVTISRQLTLAGYHFVTTEAVLLETCNTFSRACYKPIALKFVETARRSPRWQCLSVASVGCISETPCTLNVPHFGVWHCVYTPYKLKLHHCFHNSFRF